MATLNAARTTRTHKHLLAQRWSTVFDRVNTLGDDASYGHSGCVNALSWARDGELLITGGDDRTVQIWRMDPTLLHDYPFVCRHVIQTGHLANIFNAKMLPHSSNIATVAGDGQVRVPHLFLTAAEDGTVRQHDLRTSHFVLNFELSGLSLSPLTPFQLVVSGESPYGYLFDRRQAGRFLLEERGMVENGMTHCVRRFGRPASSVDIQSTREHITGARISSQNGHEVPISYSADGVYLYSTRDQPEDQDSMASMSARLLSSKKDNDSARLLPLRGLGDDSSSTTDDDMDMDIDDNASEEGSEQDLFANLEAHVSRDAYSGVPLIMPRTRFSGARNIETIKDVNFLGPDDEYVASGSDDGNFFVWRKDWNLFAPVSGPSAFSRMESAAQIMASNARQSRGFRKLRRHDFTALLAAVVADEGPQCTHQ
ncbi:WD40 repeat-like protein [Mycena vulgaris]|nr:WD40 repeat-like protein [Mycena vulgaris]